MSSRPVNPPQFERLAITAQELSARIGALADLDFGASLAAMPKQLRQFAALVPPLEWMTAEDDLLMFCPMGEIGALPLEALSLRGAPRIRRNPVMRVSNHANGLSTLAYSAAAREIAVFGDPTADLAAAPDVATRIATRFGIRPCLGGDVTTEAIEAASSSSRRLHYHGHRCWQTTSNQSPLGQ